MPLSVARLKELAKPRVLVVGDLILDEYIWGEVSRISPEAPVPVLAGNSRELKAGGAGSVVENLAVLGAEVHVLGIVGEDDGADTLLELLGGRGADVTGIVRSAERPTTRKTRLMAYVQQAHRAVQQMARVDWEHARALDGDEETRLTAALEAALAAQPAAVLVSDYEKGLLTPTLLRRVIDGARAAGVPVLIDPGRTVDYERYRGASLICPNRFEAEQASGIALREGSAVDAPAQAARKLLDELELDAVALTLDRDGIFLADSAEFQAFPTRVRAVSDVAGAGDMVLSLLGLALASHWTLVEAVELANLGAGVEVSKVGVAPIERWELEQAAREGGSETNKVRSADELAGILERVRGTSNKIVFTNGCFDILHPGHTMLLERAATLGDVLVVGLNSDASVTRLKGDDRPVMPGESRARVLGAIAGVDHIVFFEEDTPEDLIRSLRPDILVKGEDYRDRTVVGREIVEGYGGRVELIPLLPDVSTTGILGRLRGSE